MRLVDSILASFFLRQPIAKIGCIAPVHFHDRICVRLFEVWLIERPSGRANANLREVEFCAVSGQLPNKCCAHRVRGWFIPGVSPIGECELHREIWVDKETGLRVNGDNGKARSEVCEFWPSDLLELFEVAGLPRRRPPPFLPGANVEMVARSGKAPRIVSPKSDVIYSLGETSPSDRALSLRAETEADVAKVYWFADRTFLGASNRTTPLNWKPTPGNYTIMAMDDHGRSDARTIICSR